MVVENIFDSEDLERERNQENVVRRVAALNNIEATPEIDEPRIEKFPEKDEAILVYIASGAVPFLRRRVAIDVNSFENFMSPLVALPARTKDGHFVTYRM